ncbi:Formate hydrogenlyase transcriptional activator [Roseivivax sp. THAF40]|uniref:sigma 54-interacting transcriptional regulator n=1 Tax=unclassified Roseivivax TaxID=2639302 RepID=UPI0012681138|nr:MULTISPECIES: sigma 54-interacting transcriptional regulator [unclassified Roseivivax]QFS83332.1 Formate hydrogenlyase transcriptional activator [Roseivivax sp. THAF197b]QFT47076.1 Formate hydrogenlyase transcriptional activator [Roseivivax sp. THAF40]
MRDAAFDPDSLIAALPEAALILDTRADRIEAMNGAASALLKCGDIDRPRFAPHLGPALSDFIVFLEEVAYRGTGWTRDVRLWTRDGTEIRCELRARFLGNAPDLVLLLLIDLDLLEMRARIAETTGLHRAGLDEWKRAESFFAELERQNQLILNAAGEGIYGVNAEGKTTFVNRAAQEMLGWTTEDLLGRDIHSMIHHHHMDGDAYPAHDCPIYRSFRFEQVNRIEDEVFWRKDGKPIRVEYVSTPIYDQRVLAGAVVIFRDITERKEGERKLREALDEVAALRDRLEQENAYLQEAITTERAHHDIIGTSPAIRQVLSRIDLVAQTEATVMISGETGTGKALVATAIHKASPRSRRPLIHFKCGSVAPEAVEAELFGQIRGATPGAVRDKPGKLELAHGGTLFLDDVQELPVEHQGKLLHSLQSKTVTRMGDVRAKPVDIRVIAATTLPPEKAVSSGRLREDLLLHLNVFPVTCAPLRDRIEDIPLLATHILDIASRRLNRPAPVITEGTMAQMMRYDWPGNVKELRNVIDRAAIVSKGPKLVLELGGTAEDSGASHATIRTEAEMQRILRENVVACLRETGGRVSGANGAAALLGVRPTTLYSRIKSMEITENDWQ